MDRRDLSKALLASAAGTVLLTERASAQTCVEPCYPQTAEEATAGVTPTDTAFPPGWSQRYGMVGDGVTDNKSAFDRLVAACKGPTYCARIANGHYRFASRPATIGTAITIQGESKGGVWLVRDYNETVATTGFLEANGGTLVLQDVYLIAAAGKTGGCGLKLVAQASGASPDFSRISGVYISGLSNTGRWDFAILADGIARTSPPGLRDLSIDDCYFFAATSEIARFASVNNAQIRAGFFQAGGTATSLRISGVSGNPSNNIMVHASFAVDLNIDFTNYLTFISSVGLQNVNNTGNVSFAMVISPSVVAHQEFWNQSRVIANDVPLGAAGIVLSATTPVAASGQVALGTSVQSTRGGSGSASALPANPSGYLRVNIGGTNYVLPYYNA